MINSGKILIYNSKHLEEVCRHVVDIENNYSDKDGMIGYMVDEIIIEYDGDENEDEGEDDLLVKEDTLFIDMVLQLSQQSAANITESTATTNSQYNLAVMDPTYLNASNLCMPSTPMFTLRWVVPHRQVVPHRLSVPHKQVVPHN